MYTTVGYQIPLPGPHRPPTPIQDVTVDPALSVTNPLLPLTLSHVSGEPTQSPPYLPILPLRLRNMNRLANHQTAMQHKHGDNGVKLERGALEPQTEGHLLQRPALVHPIRHDLHHEQRHGNRGALEVLRLAGCVLGDHGDGDVEAGEAGEAAEDEETEENVVEWGAEAEAKGGGGRGDAKGYLGGWEVRIVAARGVFFCLDFRRGGGGGLFCQVFGGRKGGGKDRDSDVRDRPGSRALGP